MELASKFQEIMEHLQAEIAQSLMLQQKQADNKRELALVLTTGN